MWVGRLVESGKRKDKVLNSTKVTRARHGQLVATQSARPRALPALAAGAQRVDERSVGRHRDCRSGERLVSFAVGTSVTYMYMSMYM